MSNEFQKETEEIQAEIPLSEKEELGEMLMKLQRRANGKLDSFVNWSFSPSYKKTVEWRGISLKQEVTTVTIIFETLKIPGWDIVAVIDHVSSPNGNLLFHFNKEKELPEYFKIVDANCDHCNINRQRNKTTVLLNEETKQYFQVGTSCVKDFTGYDPEKLLYLLEQKDTFLHNFKSDEFDGVPSSKKGFMISTKSALKVAIAIVKAYGFQKKDSNNPTSAVMSEYIFDRPFDKMVQEINEQMPDDSIVEEFDKWFLTKDSRKNDFLHNCKVIFMGDLAAEKHFGFIAAIAGIFLKERTLGEKGEYLEFPNVNVGDKLIKIVKILSTRIIETSFGASKIYNLEDDEGFLYVWFCTGARPTDWENFKAVEFTVKDKKIYQGDHQVIISRMKVL